MQVIKQDQVQEKIITIHNQQVIFDADVAEVYKVETKRINEVINIDLEEAMNIYDDILMLMNESLLLDKDDDKNRALIDQKIGNLMAAIYKRYTQYLDEEN